jgi:hypothetical protein
MRWKEKTMKTVKIISKTALGSRILGEITKDNIGLPPTHWIVHREVEDVSWSPKVGPYLQVYPDMGGGVRHLRWIHKTNDLNFDVEEL